MTFESRIQEARSRFHESTERAEKKNKAGKILRLLSSVVWTATIIIVGLSGPSYLTVAALAVAGIWTFSSYVAKNARFRDELQSKSIWDFKNPDWLGEDNDCWYSVLLHSFSEVCAEAYEIGERDIAAAVICKLARERGLRVERNETDNGRRYILMCLKF